MQIGFKLFIILISCVLLISSTVGFSSGPPTSRNELISSQKISQKTFESTIFVSTASFHTGLPYIPAQPILPGEPNYPYPDHPDFPLDTIGAISFSWQIPDDLTRPEINRAMLSSFATPWNMRLPDYEQFRSNVIGKDVSVILEIEFFDDIVKSVPIYGNQWSLCRKVRRGLARLKFPNFSTMFLGTIWSTEPDTTLDPSACNQLP